MKLFWTIFLFVLPSFVAANGAPASSAVFFEAPAARPVADRISADRISADRISAADRLPAKAAADAKKFATARAGDQRAKRRFRLLPRSSRQSSRQSSRKDPRQAAQKSRRRFFQPLLSIPFSKKPLLKPHIIQNTQPLVLGEKVIQGDVFEGVKAFHRATGRLLWEAKGVSAGSVFVIHKDRLYFGGSDGFFYALEADSGRLVWKFPVGSEIISAPIVFQDAVYWQSSHQKIYAREIAKNGRLLWTYAGPPLPQKGFFARSSGGLAAPRGGPAPPGRPQGVSGAFPAKIGAVQAGEKRLFGGFYDGGLVALDLKTGRKIWSLPSRSPSSVSFRLQSRKGCLLVPWRGLGLFCLNQRNGKVLWKAPGGLAHAASLEAASAVSSAAPAPAPAPRGRLYQADEERIYGLNESNGRVLWEKKRDAESGLAGGGPVFFTPYKKFVIYGSPSSGSIFAAAGADGRLIGRFLFGRGLASPVTVVEGERGGEAWFFSVQGYLHKIRLN